MSPPPGRACNSPLIPIPIDINGSLFFRRSAVEAYKCLLLGLPPPVLEPDKPIELITVRRLALELDVHPKTIKRRVEAARAAALEAEEVEGG